MKSFSAATNGMVFSALCFIPGILLGIPLAGWSGSACILLAALPAFLALPLPGAKPYGLDGGKGRTLRLGLLLFSAGLFSALRGSVCTPGPGPAFALRCCGKLCACIDAINFAHGQSGALVKALLTGDRSALSPETVLLFRRSGASHLLALSGLHLGLIYLLLSKLLLPLGMSPAARRAKGLFLLLSSAFYVLMTGAPPSITRAFLFITIREVSTLLHRPQPPLHCLCTALLLQCVLSPAAPLNAGFRLSYLAVAGICIIHPRLSKLYPEGKGLFRKIWDLASISISCQCFTALESWRLFHSFPLYFLLTNLMAMPLVSLLMFSAIATVTLSALGCCPSFLTAFCDSCCVLLLRILEVVAAL